MSHHSIKSWITVAAFAVATFAMPFVQNTAYAAGSEHVIELKKLASGYTATMDGEDLEDFDYVWTPDPSNSAGGAYSGTAPSGNQVYIAHDIKYYPELDTSGYTKVTYDDEQEWAYYYTADGYTDYIYATLPVKGNETSPSMAQRMMHTATEASRYPVLHITEPGTYRISGTWDGQILVDPGLDDTNTDAKVRLILDGLDLYCGVAPGILFDGLYECDQDGNSGYSPSDSDVGIQVVIADGSDNTVEGTNVFRMLKTQYKSDSDQSTNSRSVQLQKKLMKYDGAFYSCQSMAITGESDGDGILNISSAYEGLNSEKHFFINGGHVNIYSYDDGINVNDDDISAFVLNDGIVRIMAGYGNEGDGIDSNGYIAVNGGTILVSANPASDSGLDSNKGTRITGGTVLASGSAMDGLDAGSKAMVLDFASEQSGNKAILVTNSDEDPLFAYDPAKDNTIAANTRGYKRLIINAPGISRGNSYNVYVGGSLTGTASDGLYDIDSITKASSVYALSCTGSGSSGSNNGPAGGEPPSGTPPTNGPDIRNTADTTGSTTAVFNMAYDTTYFTGTSVGTSATTITVGTGNESNTTYTVTFDSAGGSTVATQTVASGEKASRPSDPQRSGYTFKGWYKGYSLYDFDTAITSNITLTAKWELEEDGAGSGAEADETAADSSKPATDKTPQNSDTTASQPSSSENPAPSQTTVTAPAASRAANAYPYPGPTTVYDRESDTSGTYHTITFDSNGGSSVPNQTVLDGEFATEPAAPVKSGYTFNGWYSNGNIWNFSTMRIYSDMTFKASYTENAVRYTVKMYNDYGDPELITVTVPKGNTLDEPSVSNHGKTLDGWYLGMRSATGDSNESDGVPSNIKWNFRNDKVMKDIALIAVWKGSASSSSSSKSSSKSSSSSSARTSSTTSKSGSNGLRTIQKHTANGTSSGNKAVTSNSDTTNTGNTDTGYSSGESQDSEGKGSDVYTAKTAPTGDDTPIMPFVILTIIALWCVGVAIRSYMAERVPSEKEDGEKRQ